MSRSILLQHLRRWAFTPSVASVAAGILHSAQIYPWYRLFLAESQPWYLDHVPQTPISQQGGCFVPRNAAINSTSSEADVPIGSFEQTNFDRDRCFHYASRFEPYLSEAWGNTYIDKMRARLGLQDKPLITNDLLWYANLLAGTQPLLYPLTPGWSKLSPSKSCPAPQNNASQSIPRNSEGKKPRTAVVLRCYQDFAWTQDALLHLRAPCLGTADRGSSLCRRCTPSPRGQECCISCLHVQRVRTQDHSSRHRAHRVLVYGLPVEREGDDIALSPVR